MTAIICDKCGKIMKTDSEEITLLKIARPAEIFNAKEFHLCSICAALAFDFINGKKETKENHKICYSCKWYEGDNGEAPIMCKDCINCPGQTRSVVYNNYEEEA
ncbi:MAG: hypothetical protein J6Y02_02545 [Pseudobutyrivibrio sp.]|nr:hypothetical protein [Pseudobutyrivibrio sp.]